MFRADVTFKRNEFSLSAKLNLQKGSISTLVGASGSGKSTLFRLLSGLENPLTGEIYSDDVCWFDGAKKYNLPVQCRKVGMVFQDYALFEHLTVYDNIAYGVQKVNRQTVVNDWLSRINLTQKANAYPQDLSGGEKQRVALARALAIEPDILLLDEPFSALDAYFRHELRRQLQVLIRDTQIPVLISTHDLDEARFLADSIYVLVDGQIVQQGPVSEVFRKPKTVQAAKVLGWQNILAVDTFNKDEVSGKWGALPYPNAQLSISALAIPAEALTLNPLADCAAVEVDATYLSVMVTHAVDMGSYQLIEAILPDESRLVFKNSTSQVLYQDQKISVYVDLSVLLLLE